MAYTTIDDPSAHFQVTTYTGNSSDNAITNSGNSDLQPDLLWVKNRGATQDHVVFDSSRGFNGDNDSLYLETNNSDAEAHNDNDHLKSFNSDGFTMQGGSSRSNNNTIAFVAWQWKANGGSRTTFTESGNNPAGGYQANTTAGFSIVDYVGTGGAGTVSHGLGVAPYVVILKARDGSDDNEHWRVGHNSIAWTHRMQLNEDGAKSDDDGVFNDTAPTSSVFTIGDGDKINTNDENMIAYVWAPIQGYSKFGSYTGNASTNGPFVYLGFKPEFLIIKRTDSANSWYLVDGTRGSTNVISAENEANTNGAEATGNVRLDILSNGFKIRTSGAAYNADGGTYVYMSWAKHPFVSSEGVPVTAR